MSTTIADLPHEADLSAAAQIAILKAKLAHSEEIRDQLTQTANDLTEQLREALKNHEETNTIREQVDRELEMVKEDRLRLLADRNELETDRDKLFQEIYLFVVQSLEIANKRFKHQVPT